MFDKRSEVDWEENRRNLVSVEKTTNEPRDWMKTESDQNHQKNSKNQDSVLVNSWPKVQRTTQQNIESESGLDNTRCFPYFERII